MYLSRPGASPCKQRDNLGQKVLSQPRWQFWQGERRIREEKQ